MSISEAVCYINGQDRRHRQQWEQTRLLTGTVCKILTGEDIELHFSWDNDNITHEETSAEDLERLRALAREAEKQANGSNL